MTNTQCQKKQGIESWHGQTGGVKREKLTLFIAELLLAITENLKMKT